MPSRVERFPAINQEAKGPVLSSVTARPRVAYCGPEVWLSEKYNTREGLLSRVIYESDRPPSKNRQAKSSA
jgi:hypothetical protein